MGRLHSKAPAEALGLAVLGEAQPAWSVRRKRNKEGFADRDISPCTTALSCPQFVTTAGWTLARVGRWPVQVVQSLACLGPHILGCVYSAGFSTETKSRSHRQVGKYADRQGMH